MREATSGLISKGSINDSLLILANISTSKRFPSHSGFSDSLEHITQYIIGLRHQPNSFHHYGLVRMLAWLPDSEKTTFLPRAITERKSFSVRLDLAAQVSEIAGGSFIPSTFHKPRRQHDLAVQSERLAAQRAEEAGIWDPEDRRPPPTTVPWYEIGLCSDALDQLRRLPCKLPWQDKLLALEEEWSKRKSKVTKQVSKTKREAGRPRSVEPKDLRLLRTKFLTIRKANTLAQQWALQQNDLDKAEIEMCRGFSRSRLAATEEDIQREAAKLHTEIGKGRKDLAFAARKYIDDRRGFEQDPPLLQWDRRIAEPLLVQNHEFYPRRKMALLDLKPAPEVFSKLTTFDQRTCFDYLCGTLFHNPARCVRNDLANVVQGGLEEFLERVPDLSDPSKGGNSNLDDLRIRTLPVNLLIQLALALEDWPFRLQTHEMVMSIARKKGHLFLDI